LSQVPREFGFGRDVMPTGGSGSDERGAAAAGFAVRRESEEDVRRTKQLVDEVRFPSPHLTFAQTAAAVTITDEQGRSRTFHPDVKEEVQPLDSAVVPTSTRWEGERLVVRYKVALDRELRYTYSRTVTPPQVVVKVEFIERGGHDTLTFVYEPARADEPSQADRAAPPAVAPGPIAGATGLPGGGQAAKAPPAAPPEPSKSTVPALPDRVTSPVVVGRPDAELTGLTALGLLVEDLSPQAAACGLRKDAIEAAVSRSLADAGLKVIPYTDRDTYVDVSVMATSASAGLCVSRFDVTLFTRATTTLPYQGTATLVQVSLLHKDGIAGGAPGALGDAVVRNVKQVVDEFAARIRSANR
jgi:hypothetical protein